jgi:pimeloyl-ACP methyl ester carboxylesterase
MPRHLTVAGADPAAWGVSKSAVRVPVDSAQWLYAWLFPRQAPGRRPCGTVLLLHGNAGDVTQFRGLGEWLAASGLQVLAVDYRGYGASPGTPSEDNLRADARAAYRYVRDVLGEPPGRVVLIGHSLGASLAVEVAARDSVAGLVLFSAFPSFGPLIRQRAPLLATLFDTDRFSLEVTGRLADVRAPATVIVGDEDPFVRVADAEAVARGVSARPGGLVVVAGGGHNGLWQYPSAWRATNRLLDRAMSGACEGARPQEGLAGTRTR